MTETGNPEITRWINTLDDNFKEMFHERAAIRQHEGGLSQEEAEDEARWDVISGMGM